MCRESLLLPSPKSPSSVTGRLVLREVTATRSSTLLLSKCWIASQKAAHLSLDPVMYIHWLNRMCSVQRWMSAILRGKFNCSGMCFSNAFQVESAKLVLAVPGLVSGASTLIGMSTGRVNSGGTALWFTKYFRTMPWVPSTRFWYAIAVSAIHTTQESSFRASSRQLSRQASVNGGTRPSPWLHVTPGNIAGFFEMEGRRSNLEWFPRS